MKIRNLSDVIDDILVCIPDEFDAFARKRLNAIKLSLYSDPEQIEDRWVDCAAVLNTWFSPIDTNWKRKIKHIFARSQSNGSEQNDN